MIYVEKEALINKFVEGGSCLSKDQIIYLINRLPATEIVTCGECDKKYIKGMNAYCPYRVSHVMASDFCSYGEKGEE